ncbi:MAG: glycosyltransferase family 2 protein [candidate division Zixibacteria bacterium]|nr:glycosyltransferase family 2 protein [candidate division Zixibacteria bacterium]
MVNLNKKTLVIIPAYNAGSLLSQLLEKLQEIHPLEHTLIVNDGSTDDTEKYALEFKVNIIKHPHNMGKGIALISGFQFAYKNNYDAVITIDADLQHPPEYIPQLIKCAEEGGYDMVIGSRRKMLRKIPLQRRFSNFTTSWIVSKLAGMEIEDSQSGYRYISRNLIEKVKLTEPGYMLETEIIVKAIREGFKIGFSPIPAVYNNAPSSIKVIKDTLRFIRLTLKLKYT